MDSKLNGCPTTYLNSINQIHEQAKSNAKAEANKKRAELERELVLQAKRQHEDRLKKWKDVSELLYTTGAIEAPLDKIRYKLEQLGNRYCPGKTLGSESKKGASDV
ncbi:hypothetical protein G6726_06175 [Polynucleobacter paneuropaeus]|nr:hypothetical protein G6726_06175 [Polynucleobacter paneuropaeus]